jgi:hypothetical protein
MISPSMQATISSPEHWSSASVLHDSPVRVQKVSSHSRLVEMGWAVAPDWVVGTQVATY